MNNNCSLKYPIFAEKYKGKINRIFIINIEKYNIYSIKLQLEH
jgi:hypothetical protein